MCHFMLKMSGAQNCHDHSINGSIKTKLQVFLHTASEVALFYYDKNLFIK